MVGKNSKIYWPKKLNASAQSTYESVSILYKETRPDVFGDHIGLILSCTKDIHYDKGCDSCFHKLEVVASPNFLDASMEVTHEVLPELGPSSEIINVNENLITACFDSGSIMEIKNFGYKKTFNSDVRGRLVHHTGAINRITADSTGSQLASGTVNGEIALYSVRKEKIEFISRSKVTNDLITGLSYLQPSDQICYKPKDMPTTGGENILVYSTSSGSIGFVDTRCKSWTKFDNINIMTTEPRLNFSSLCSIPELSGHQVFLGTAHGHIMSFDLRHLNKCVFKQELEDDICIRRMRKIVVYEDSGRKRIFLAYINGTDKIEIIDVFTKQPDEKWTCDRNPSAKQRDLKQIGNRIVTCGEKTSIGCWTWNSRVELRS